MKSHPHHGIIESSYKYCGKKGEITVEFPEM
jgi:hypothetical protein